ncbi:MAG: hypothetical protein WC631_00680 [Candidatus Paceibacterota bacterium]|jgi:hypothetical protein
MLALQTQPTKSLSTSWQAKYIRKAVQLPNGSWALVVFELVEVNGKIVAKAVCGKILGEKCFDQEVILALPAYFERETIEPIVSPFFSYISTLVKDLAFITCQQPRAPTF